MHLQSIHRLDLQYEGSLSFLIVAHLLVLVVSCLAAALVVRLILRHVVVDFSDGAHIVDLVKVKLLHGNRTFHTQLYTCSEAFDFLPVRPSVTV